MAIDTKVLDKNPVSVGQTTSIQSQASVGAGSKEMGDVAEFVKPFGAEIVPNIPPEASEHVKVKSDGPNLTPEHEGLIEHAGPHVPISVTPSDEVTLSMSEEEITRLLNTGRDDDSSKGLAKLIKKVKKVALRLLGI